MKLRHIMAGFLVVALAIILLIHFSLMWIYGWIAIGEDNKYILSAETIMSVGVLLFGMDFIRVAVSATKQRLVKFVGGKNG